MEFQNVVYMVIWSDLASSRGGVLKLHRVLYLFTLVPHGQHAYWSSPRLRCNGGIEIARWVPHLWVLMDCSEPLTLEAYHREIRGGVLKLHRVFVIPAHSVTPGDIYTARNLSETFA